MWILLALIVLVCLCLDYYMHVTEHGKMHNSIPGPTPWPIIGNIVEFMYNPVGLFYRSRYMSNKYKGRFRLWILNIRIISTMDHNDMEIVLSNQRHIKKGDIYTFLHPWLKDGLLTSTGDKWQKRRKILTPTFHFNILRQFCKIFDEQSKSLAEDLKAEVGKPETNVIAFMTKFALNSICETAMGTKIDSDVRGHSYKRSVYRMGELFIYRVTRLWLRNPLLFALSPTAREQGKTLSVLHRFTSDVIRERRISKEWLNTELTPDDQISGGDLRKKKIRLAMLDLLLSAEAKGEIDENGIREEVDTFMFEGHDTTSMALSFCLMLLANNPDAQERIVSECNDIIEDPNREVTIDDLNNMRYLEMCIKESLRLYPSVPFIARRCEEEVKLKDCTVPAGTAFHFHIFDMHRDAKIYPNPDVFDPERFSIENCAKRHPFSYIPFSAGPRNCIGQRFALLEEKSIISTILLRYRLEPVTTPNDIVFSSDLVLRSKYPINVKFVLR